MKKSRLIVLIIFIVVAIIAFVTNPNEEKHKEVAKLKLNEIVANSAQKYGINKNIINVLGINLSDEFYDGLINKMVKSDNYYLFSTTKLNWGDNKYVIGIGAFGKVYIYPKVEEMAQKELEKYIDTSIKNIDLSKIIIPKFK